MYNLAGFLLALACAIDDELAPGEVIVNDFGQGFYVDANITHGISDGDCRYCLRPIAGNGVLAKMGYILPELRRVPSAVLSATACSRQCAPITMSNVESHRSVTVGGARGDQPSPPLSRQVLFDAPAVIANTHFFVFDNDCNDDKGRESERDTEKQEPGSGSILASLCGIGPFAAGARTALSAWVWLSPPDTLSKGAGNDDQGPRALFHVPLRTLPEAEYTLDSRLGWSDSSSGGTKDNAGADLSPAVVVGHPSAPEHFLVLADSSQHYLARGGRISKARVQWGTWMHLTLILTEPEAVTGTLRAPRLLFFVNGELDTALELEYRHDSVASVRGQSRGQTTQKQPGLEHGLEWPPRLLSARAPWPHAIRFGAPSSALSPGTFTAAEGLVASVVLEIGGACSGTDDGIGACETEAHAWARSQFQAIAEGARLHTHTSSLRVPDLFVVPHWMLPQAQRHMYSATHMDLTVALVGAGDTGNRPNTVHANLTAARRLFAAAVSLARGDLGCVLKILLTEQIDSLVHDTYWRTKNVRKTQKHGVMHNASTDTNGQAPLHASQLSRSQLGIPPPWGASSGPNLPFEAQTCLPDRRTAHMALLMSCLSAAQALRVAKSAGTPDNEYSYGRQDEGQDTKAQASPKLPVEHEAFIALGNLHYHGGRATVDASLNDDVLAYSMDGSDATALPAGARSRYQERVSDAMQLKAPKMLANSLKGALAAEMSTKTLVAVSPRSEVSLGYFIAALPLAQRRERRHGSHHPPEVWLRIGDWSYLGEGHATFKTQLMKARAGHAQSQRYVGSHYQWGLEGLKKDTVQALHWWQQAAKQGDHEAAYSMAHLHDQATEWVDGKERPKERNATAARQSLELAVELGSTVAMRDLAEHHLQCSQISYCYYRLPGQQDDDVQEDSKAEDENNQVVAEDYEAADEDAENAQPTLQIIDDGTALNSAEPEVQASGQAQQSAGDAMATNSNTKVKTVRFGEGRLGLSFRREDDGRMMVTEVKGQAEQLGVARGDRIVGVSNDDGYHERVPDNDSMSQDDAIKMITGAGRPFDMQLDTSARERLLKEALDAGQARDDTHRSNKKQRNKKTKTRAKRDAKTEAKRTSQRPLANISFGVDLVRRAAEAGDENALCQYAGYLLSGVPTATNPNGGHCTPDQAIGWDGDTGSADFKRTDQKEHACRGTNVTQAAEMWLRAAALTNPCGLRALSAALLPGANDPHSVSDGDEYVQSYVQSGSAWIARLHARWQRAQWIKFVLTRLRAVSTEGHDMRVATVEVSPDAASVSEAPARTPASYAQLRESLLPHHNPRPAAFRTSFASRWRKDQTISNELTRGLSPHSRDAVRLVRELAMRAAVGVDTGHGVWLFREEKKRHTIANTTNSTASTEGVAIDSARIADSLAEYDFAATIGHLTARSNTAFLASKAARDAAAAANDALLRRRVELKYGAGNTGRADGLGARAEIALIRTHWMWRWAMSAASRVSQMLPLPAFPEKRADQSIVLDACDFGTHGELRLDSCAAHSKENIMIPLAGGEEPLGATAFHRGELLREVGEARRQLADAAYYGRGLVSHANSSCSTDPTAGKGEAGAVRCALGGGPDARDMPGSARAFSAAAALRDARSLFALGFAAEAGERGVLRSARTAARFYGAAVRAGTWQTAWPSRLAHAHTTFCALLDSFPATQGVCTASWWPLAPARLEPDPLRAGFGLLVSAGTDGVDDTGGAGLGWRVRHFLTLGTGAQSPLQAMQATLREAQRKLAPIAHVLGVHAGSAHAGGPVLAVLSMLLLLFVVAVPIFFVRFMSQLFSPRNQPAAT